MLKKLLQSVKVYKKDSILTPAFVIIEVMLEIAIPMVMAIIIDKGITGNDTNTLASLGTVLIICVILGLIFGTLSGGFAARASAGFAQNLRQDMYYKIQDYSFANLDKFSTSSIVSRLTTDVTNVQNAYMMIIRVAVRAPVMLVFSLIAAFIVNKQLSLIFLVAIPILGICLGIIVAKSHGPFEKVFRIYDKLNSVVQENLAGIRVVKSFVREDFETSKFEKVSTNIYKTFTKAEKIIAYNMPIMQFVVYSCMLLLSWFGARMIVLSNSTAMTTGELTSMIAYAMQILSCLMMLSMVFVMINMARASSERIVEILNENSSLKNGKNPISEVKNGDIVFSNVSFGYNNDQDKSCLQSIEFKIPTGSTLGIVGETGSGKTSLVQLIPRLYDVTEGEMLVAGINVKDYDLYTLRNEVAMVLQKKRALFRNNKREFTVGK